MFLFLTVVPKWIGVILIYSIKLILMALVWIMIFLKWQMVKLLRSTTKTLMVLRLLPPNLESGVFGPDTAGAVRWGAEYSNEAPAIAANKTNLYTFVRMNTGIFASAVTGYVY